MGSGVALLGDKLGPDQPQLGHQVESVRCLKDPEQSMTPGNITDDDRPDCITC